QGASFPPAAGRVAMARVAKPDTGQGSVSSRWKPQCFPKPEARNLPTTCGSRWAIRILFWICHFRVATAKVIAMSRFFTLLLLVAAPAPTAAQPPDTASIRGQVVDPTRAVVTGAEVKVTNTVLGWDRTMRTDSSGSFVFSGLPAGAYSLVARKEKFADFHHEITLIGGVAADIQVQLSISEVKTEVVVTGAAGEVRSDQPQLGDRLGQFEIDETPLLTRRITFLPLLNAANRPAINQGDVFTNQNLFTTNGSGRRQTSWVVDGTNGNDSWGRQ